MQCVELIKDTLDFKAGTQFKVDRSFFCDYTVDEDYYYGRVLIGGQEKEIQAKWSQCKHITENQFVAKVIPNQRKISKTIEYDSYLNYP